nr:hypothetical protein [Tanacetum cinerariifolium]
MLDGKLMFVVKHEKSLEMKVTNEASTSNPNTSMRDQLVESNEDEVDFSEVETSKYMFSSSGGGFCLHFYDRYEAQVYDLPEQMQTFCDQFGLKHNGAFVLPFIGLR